MMEMQEMYGYGNNNTQDEAPEPEKLGARKHQKNRNGSNSRSNSRERFAARQAFNDRKLSQASQKENHWSNGGKQQNKDTKY